MSDITIRIRDNGSILIEGAAGVKIVDSRGAEFGLGGRNAISLCRCGQTQNAPFCDGSHNRCGWKSEVTARDLPPVAPKA